MWLYGTAKFLAGVFYRSIYRIRIEGVENLPREGGVIVCGNHFKGHDPLVVAISANRPISFMAKQEIFKTPVVGWLAKSVGAFPVKRGQPDRAALKRSIDVLQAGGCFGIFPEGTRNRTGKLGKAEPGTAYLALKSGAPIVPVGISSTYKLFSPVVIKFGRPLSLNRYAGNKLTGEVLEAAGEEIMGAIGALLVPPADATVAAGKEE